MNCQAHFGRLCDSPPSLKSKSHNLLLKLNFPSFELTLSNFFSHKCNTSFTLTYSSLLLKFALKPFYHKIQKQVTRMAGG